MPKGSPKKKKGKGSPKKQKANMPTYRERLHERRDDRREEREDRRDRKDDRSDARREDRVERHETGITRWDQNAQDGTGLGSGNTKEVFWDAAQTITGMLPGSLINAGVTYLGGDSEIGDLVEDVWDLPIWKRGNDDDDDEFHDAQQDFPPGKPIWGGGPKWGETIFPPGPPPSYNNGPIVPYTGGANGIYPDKPQSQFGAGGMKPGILKPGGAGGYTRPNPQAGSGASAHHMPGGAACSCKRAKPKPPPLSCLEKAKIRCMKTDLIKDLEKAGLFCALKKPKKVPPKKKPLCRPRSSTKKKKSTAGSKKKKAKGKSKSSTKGKKKTATKKKKPATKKKLTGPKGGIMNTCFR